MPSQVVVVVSSLWRQPLTHGGGGGFEKKSNQKFPLQQPHVKCIDTTLHACFHLTWWLVVAEKGCKGCSTTVGCYGGSFRFPANQNTPTLTSRLEAATHIHQHKFQH